MKNYKGEQVAVYDLDGNFLEIMDRKKFYKEVEKEYKKTGKITSQVRTVKVMIMNRSGKICLQRRSRRKKQNPGMFDKTFGGHVSINWREDETVIIECGQELGFATSIYNEADFQQALRAIPLDTVGVFRKVGYINQSMSVRTFTDGSQIIQPQMVSFYIGYYDGGIKFVDGECSGIQFFELDELKDDIFERPEDFTQDVKDMFKEYEKYFLPIK